MIGCQYFGVLLVPLLVVSYDLICPENLERTHRIQSFCNDTLQASYSCLLDEHTNAFQESCTDVPNFVRPGQRYVIRGFRTNSECSQKTYQPFKFWSNKYSKCIFIKSLCSGTGQIPYKNTSTIEDNKCRCDHNDGYAYIAQPRNTCYCVPTEEDCTCFKKKCPSNNTLSSDYSCMSNLTTIDLSVCQDSIDTRFKTTKVTSSKVLKNTKDSRQIYRQGNYTVFPLSLVFITEIVIVFLMAIIIGYFKKIKKRLERSKVNEDILSTVSRITENSITSEGQKSEITENSITSEGQKSEIKVDQNMFSLLPFTTCIAMSREKDMLNTIPRGSHYEIQYRILNAVECKTLLVSFEEINTEIVGLKSDTVYDIKVYLHTTDDEVHMIFKASCKTKESCARYLKATALIIRDRSPQIYHLQSYDRSRNCNDICQGDPIIYLEKTYHPKSCSIHVPVYEKTLLILGGTGAGKSTFINALINYVADVSYDDTHRFALIDPNERNTERHTGLQCKSETSSVTMYRLPKFESSKVDSELTIIDTPGFTDTELDFNKVITTCLHNMFKTRTYHLDAVLLFMPSSAQTLTNTQKHLFSSILKMFSKDIVDNIFVILTYHDGGKPKACIKLLEQLSVPCKYVYQFNNGNVLNAFGSNCSLCTTSQNESIWNSRTKSFNDLFQDLKNVQKKSLSLTVKVNDLQTDLQNQLSNLDEQISELSQNMFNHKKIDLKEEDVDKSFSRCQQTLVKSQQLIQELKHIALDIGSICNMQVYIEDLIKKAKERGSEGFEKFKVLILEKLLHNFKLH